MNPWLQRRKTKNIEFLIKVDVFGNVITAKIFDITVNRVNDLFQFHTSDSRITHWAYGGSIASVTVKVQNKAGKILEVWDLPAARSCKTYNVSGAVCYVEIKSPFVTSIRSDYIEYK